MSRLRSLRTSWKDTLSCPCKFKGRQWYINCHGNEAQKQREGSTFLFNPEGEGT